MGRAQMRRYHFSVAQHIPQDDVTWLTPAICHREPSELASEIIYFHYYQRTASCRKISAKQDPPCRALRGETVTDPVSRRDRIETGPALTILLFSDK